MEDPRRRKRRGGRSDEERGLGRRAGAGPVQDVARVRRGLGGAERGGSVTGWAWPV